jgi:hypothetical protein
LVDTFIVEPAKMVYDYQGLYVQSLGILTGWWDYEHEVASGIGHLAAGGKDTGDILLGMGRNIGETPGRLWRTIERGNYWDFGAESMNIYTVGRTVTGVARGTATWAYNRGITVLGRLRSAEPALGGSYQDMFRGVANQEGSGVLWVRNAAAFSEPELRNVIAWVREMDFQAGMSGGFIRQAVPRGSRLRLTGNRHARIANTALRLDRSQAAMHMPDIAAGGDPIGIMMGGPRGINASWGGQLGRYQPGFRFTGFSLVDRTTGQYLYPSLSLEHAPLSFNPW